MDLSKIITIKKKSDKPQSKQPVKKSASPQKLNSKQLIGLGLIIGGILFVAIGIFTW